MKLTFLTNLVNHHQIPLADEFYKLLGDDYVYVAFESLPNWLIQGGYQEIERPYILRIYENQEYLKIVEELMNCSDVVIIGQAPDKYVLDRIKKGKLTFRYNERWFKSRPWYLYNPKAWISFYNNHIRFKKKSLYMLAASAYTANDVYSIGAYKDKVYKWGYFTSIPDNIEKSKFNTLKNSKYKIMWCSRFLKLKHPELPIKLAYKLKKDGYNFIINMFGSGEELEKSKLLVKKLNVEDVVSFRGNMPNHKILDEMKKHQIFLFTSDKNEGWGAVLNESMSNGCAVVASNKIGATPFLINDGENGLIFKSENINSLYFQVKLLLDNKEILEKISVNAYKTMSEIWSPKNAAERFIELAKSLQMGKDTPYIEGPCSKAYPCKY